jgi:hypothetical protein
VLVKNIVSQKEHILLIKYLSNSFVIIIIKYLLKNTNIYVIEATHVSRVQNIAVVFRIHGILMVIL